MMMSLLIKVNVAVYMAKFRNIHVSIVKEFQLRVYAAHARVYV